MKTILLLATVVLTSCKPKAAFEYDNPSLDMAIPDDSISEFSKTSIAEVDFYKDEFVNLASTYNYTVIKKTLYSAKKDLRNLPGHILGQCITFDDANLIVVDKTFWATASDFNKRSLIFHELGHCLLGRGHRTLYYQGPYLNYGSRMAPYWDYVTHPNWPISLMHRSLVTDAKFKGEYDYYIQELFDETNVSEFSVPNKNVIFNCSDE